MKRVLVHVGVVAIYAIGLVLVVVMARGFLREWGADPWKMAVALPVLGVFVWGALEHYLGD